MPKFFIKYSFGYHGTESADVIEAEDLEDAQEAAWEMAVEHVSSSAEPYDPEKHDGRY